MKLRCRFTSEGLWLLILAAMTGCDPAPSDLLLAGTGERLTPAVASISGTVAIPGATFPYPPIRVYALRDIDTTCVSDFTVIQALGNHTDPEFSVGGTPAMARLAGCVWVDSLFLDPDAFARTPGRWQWKFVTNRNFDSPPDYGVPGGEVNGLEGGLTLGANGDDGNILADVSQAGPYLALLDEQKLRYAVLPWVEAPLGDVDGRTGAFTVDRLRDGTYTLVFRGEGVVTRRLTRIVVSGGAAVGVGQVTVRSASLAITGRVGFEDNPSPEPVVEITLSEALSGATVGQASTSDAFSFVGIDLGSYRLRLRTSGYRDSTLDLSYTGTLIDLGTIILRRGCSSQFDRIQVAGNLNEALYGNFDLSRSPDMARIDGCVWQTTLNGIAAGDHFFKFVTDGAFDTPPDYGSDEICRTELTGSVSPVSGTGTAICVTFPADGNYRFTLDEEDQTYRIEQIIVMQPGSIRGTVSFSETPAPGLKAFIRLFERGTTNLVDSDSTAAAFEFTELAAGDYDVRFSATGYADSTRQATVLAGQATDLGDTRLAPGFVSQFNRIQVVGNLNIPLYGNFVIATSPGMTRTSPGVWRATLTGITGGNKLWKFVTNGAFDSPPDYGLDEVCRTDPAGPVRLVTGIGTAICVTFPSGTADYEFVLDERALTFAVIRQGQAGQGAIQGTVNFENTSGPPFPRARVALQTQAGATDIGVTTTDPTTRGFSFTMLDAGTYKVIVSSDCFNGARVENISVAQATVTLPAVSISQAPSSFSTIQIPGSFNGFDLGTASFMTQISPCLWADTLFIENVASPVEFKFVTDGAYDNPPDYGIPGGQTDPLGGPLVSGVPGGDGNIVVQLPEPGGYRFELNERFLMYSITRVSGLPAPEPPRPSGVRQP